MWTACEGTRHDAGACGSVPELWRDAQNPRSAGSCRAQAQESAKGRPRRRLCARTGKRVFHAGAEPVPSRPGSAGAGDLLERKSARPMADGLLPPLDQPETNWFASSLYPLRGADGLGMIAATSTLFWLFTVLIPGIA